MRTIISMLVSCIVLTKSYSQNKLSDNSTTSLIKNQVGIGISKFVNSAFSSDKNAYNIEYRYRTNEKTAYRAGINYEKDSSESGYLEGGIKIGIDKTFRQYEHWNFYYGIDFFGNYSNYKNTNKDIYSYGIAPLLGIQYVIAKNFSLSIEPGIYIKCVRVIDHATFNPDNTTTWTESGLGKLGYIQLNFHF